MALALQAGAGLVASIGASGRGDHEKAQRKWNRLSRTYWDGIGGFQKLTIGVVPRTSETFNQQKWISVAVNAGAGDSLETKVEEKTSGDVLPSGDWPENFSLLNFEDLISHYEPFLFKSDAQPGTYLADVMSKTVYTAFPGQTLSEVDHFFKEISGVPVIDHHYKVIGVLSKKDRLKAAEGEDPNVKDLMSSPAITLSADKTVMDAAALMLKNKIHRIPVVNSSNQIVGMVTRTDIFSALDQDPK